MRDDALAAASPDAAGRPPASAGIGTEAADRAQERSPALPRDHPAWQRDVISVSARAREIVARLRPLAIRALTFWDHVRRSTAIAGRTLEIDPSGSYRLR